MIFEIFGLAILPEQMLRGSDSFEPQAGTERQATTARYVRVVDPNCGR